MSERNLTRAQRQTLALLREHGHVWPAGRGRTAISGGPVASRRTLDALVDLGLAQGIIPSLGSGVLPYYEPRS